MCVSADVSVSEIGGTFRDATRDSVSPKPKMVWDRSKRNRKWSGAEEKETENGLGRTGLDLLQVILMNFRLEYIEYVIIVWPRTSDEAASTE